jgi:CRP/FNR family transcriptional regulator, cyclic AMP receptor protein
MEEAVKPLSDIPAINRFLSYCRIRTVPSKTVVIHAGDLPDVLYYIISGSVEVMVEDEEGNEMVLAYLNKGQFFGEMGLFHESPLRSAWVRTRNHCELAEMTYPRFRRDSTAPTENYRISRSSTSPAVWLTPSWTCAANPMP